MLRLVGALVAMGVVALAATGGAAAAEPVGVTSADAVGADQVGGSMLHPLDGCWSDPVSLRYTLPVGGSGVGGGCGVDCGGDPKT
jgi:hypothetical protein